jgi:HSP20 family molecular chaperone IbpA
MAENKIKVNVDPARIEPGEDTYAPLVDIYEDDKGGMVLVAEVPGATGDSVDIRVDKGVLTLAVDGRRENSDDSYTRTYTGFVSGQYFRAFAISDELDRDQIEASLNSGLLLVKLPRAEAAQTRKIEITEG